VIVSVMLCGLLSMMRRVDAMPVCNVGMMSGLVVVTVFVVLGRFAVMMCGILMVFRGGVMVVGTLVLGAHVALP